MRLQVVEIKTSHPQAGVTPSPETDAFRAAGVYDVAADVRIVTPQLAPEEVGDDAVETLGLFGSRIARAVAAGLADRRQVVLVGGNCTALPGVIGGLEQAQGPAARIGLVWFDAHGDFNTPQTTPSGMLGGMPVAVVAGLCHPRWREGSGQLAPIPTDRILMVDVRNLDPEEAQLVHATGVAVVPPEAGAVGRAARQLAETVDAIYLHVDLDVLDAALTPSHRTKEPHGPGIAQTQACIDAVFDTDKVVAFGLVSIYPVGEGGEVSLASGTALLRASLAHWQSREGVPQR